MAALPAVNLTTEWTHLFAKCYQIPRTGRRPDPPDIAGYLAGTHQHWTD